MLTHTHLKSKPARFTERPWLLILLVFVWLWPGIFSHDLWTPTEPLLYAVIQNSPVLNSFSWQSILPIEYSVLFVWLGRAFYHLFAIGSIHHYTAVRFLTAGFMALGLACAGGAGRELLGRKNGRSVVLILIGCPGLMVFGHMLGMMPLRFAGLCLFSYGTALCLRKKIIGSLLMSCGSALVLGAGSWVLLILTILVAILLPIHLYWRNHNYMISLLIYLSIITPITLSWLYFLQLQNPEHFLWWWEHIAWGLPNGFRDINWAFRLPEIFKNMLWYTLPAWLLTIWSLYKIKIVPSHIRFFVALWLILSIVPVAIQGEYSNHLLMPTLLPLAIFGAVALDYMKRGVSSFLNGFGVMIFGSLAIFLWLGFFAMNYGIPHALAVWALQVSPYYRPQWDYFPMIIALSFTPIWLWAVTRKHVRGRQALTNWASGMTFAWTLLLTLFLPFLDSTKSYRLDVEHMLLNIPTVTHQELTSGSQCITTNSTTALLAWNEYAFPIYRTGQKECRYHIGYNLLSKQKKQFSHSRLVWHSLRSGQSKSVFALWEQIK